MLKFLLVLFSTMIFTISLQAQSNQQGLTLDDFKEGIYVYADGKYKGGKITRTKKWQIEEYPNLKLKFRINWIGNFEYHLTCVQVSSESSQSMLGQIVKVKVLDVEDDTYSVLVQNGRKFDKVHIQMVDENPKNQESFFAVVNSFK